MGNGREIVPAEDGRHGFHPLNAGAFRCIKLLFGRMFLAPSPSAPYTYDILARGVFKAARGGPLLTSHEC